MAGQRVVGGKETGNPVPGKQARKQGASRAYIGDEREIHNNLSRPAIIGTGKREPTAGAGMPGTKRGSRK